MRIKNFLLFTYLLLLFPAAAFAGLVEYDIDIDYQTVNYTGKDVQAMTIGGTIPGTLIEATEGDTLRVTFHNKMDVNTSIHWHGILLPNDQDGVPYVTTMPIRAHDSLTYEYPVIQSGTYWYHSHTGLQEQRGVYGPLVFYPKEKAYDYDKEFVITLSDWTDENPKKVLRNLKREGHYYSLKKDTVQSWQKVIAHGWKAIWLRIKSAWIRMGPMDVSDIGYDAFLMNGSVDSKIGDMQPGEKVLLRIINMSASTHFDVEFAGGKMNVMASDGIDVEPFKVDRFRIAVAESYDVIITIPEEKSYELRATAMDVSGFASGYLGSGSKVQAKAIEKLNPFLMDHSSHGNSMPDMKMSGMADHSMHHGHHMMHHGPKILDYDDLKAKQVTEYAADAPVREIPLRLTGNMERYIWSFNNKTLKEADFIHIKKGEVVRLKLINETMMAHPIHLHGHFFRVLNKQGAYSPLKHTVDVLPMETTVIEFFADQEKDWLFHCHILYHMMSGMTRIFRYEGSMRDPKLMAAAKADKYHKLFDDWYAWGHIAPQSNMVEGFLRAADVRNQFEVKWDNNYTGEYDVETKYFRNVTRFLDLYVGGEFERDEHYEIENHATWGFRYVLPLLVEMEYEMNHGGGQSLEFHGEWHLTDRLEAHAFYKVGFGLEENWDYSDFHMTHEYRAELEYRVSKSFSLIGNYDSEHRGGGGVKLRF